jgi:predicted nucleic acid-binding protein
VKRYFDTSVLVAALVQGEPIHAACLRELANVTGAITSTHTIGEVFATLTSGRLPVQFTPADAERAIQANIVRTFQIVPFSAADYVASVAACGKVGARGGGFYDVLHLQAARMAKADEILTLNERHFKTFAPDLASQIRRP